MTTTQISSTTTTSLATSEDVSRADCCATLADDAYFLSCGDVICADHYFEHLDHCAECRRTVAEYGE